MGEKPGGVLLYDSLDRPNADKKQQSDTKSYVRFDYKLALVGILALIIVFFFLYLIHSYAWYLYQDYEYRNIGAILLVTIYFSFSAFLLGSVTIFLKYLYTKAERAGLINVMEHQTMLQRLKYTSYDGAYFDVMGRKADKSLFTNAQNITYSPHNERHEAQPIQEISDENTALALTDEPLPELQEMKRQGLIGRSGNSILIGWGEKDEE
jgi:hypothetical protein